MSPETPWWQIAKAQSLERKAKQASTLSNVQAGDAFLIVTEGRVTEPVYFELLRSDLQGSAIQIRVVPGTHSASQYVIETAARAAKNQLRKAKRGQLSIREPAKFDHVWAVIDTDVAVRDGFWNEVETLARSRNVKLAYSTPCFEFWLLLHIRGFTTGPLLDGESAKRAVGQELKSNYSTNEKVARQALQTLIDKWPDAVGNGDKVREFHISAATPLRANPSTEVCALVRALNDSVPEHQRKL